MDSKPSAATKGGTVLVFKKSSEYVGTLILRWTANPLLPPKEEGGSNGRGRGDVIDYVEVAASLDHLKSTAPRS